MKWEISQIDDEDDLIPFSQKWIKPQLRCASIRMLVYRIRLFNLPTKSRV